MANTPCPECGDFNQKETFVGRELHGDKVVDVYQVECKECGEVWDDECLVKSGRS